MNECRLKSTYTVFGGLLSLLRLVKLSDHLSYILLLVISGTSFTRALSVTTTRSQKSKQTCHCCKGALSLLESMQFK